MRTSVIHRYAVAFAMLVGSGCSPKNGDKVSGLPEVPLDATVVLRTYHPQAVLQLPESLRSRFVQMVHQDATYVDFSGATAAPLAQFEIGELIFYWHGNSVVHGQHRKGQVWTSHFMQALIHRATPFPQSAEEWKGLLDGLATATDIDATPVESLGRYPRH